MKRTHVLSAATRSAALLIATVAGIASPPSSFEIPDNSIIVSPCTGEFIQLSGSVTIKTSYSVQNGIAHISLQIKEHATGVGLTSGNSYIINGQDNQNSDLKLVNNTGEENAIFTSNVIGQGSAPNEHLKSTLHVTVNTDGTLTVERVSLTDTCH
jgi:hypothetical protein